MRKIASLWIGEKLGEIELASINSFLNTNHEYILYTYQPITNVPKGVIVVDANDILSGNPITYHKKTGSPAIHSDLFRYTLMAKTNHIWVDLDLIALKPFDFDTDWIIGYESEDSIGAAVLRLPEHSKTLKALLAINANTKGLPPTLQGYKRLRYQAKSIWYGGLGIDRWPYGVTGPGLITYYMNQFDEHQYALPQSAFCPIHYRDIHKVSDADSLNLAKLTENSWAIHLWGKTLRKHISTELAGNIPKNSLLAEILSKYGDSDL